MFFCGIIFALIGLASSSSKSTLIPEPSDTGEQPSYSIDTNLYIDTGEQPSYSSDTNLYRTTQRDVSVVTSSHRGHNIDIYNAFSV